MKTENERMYYVISLKHSNLPALCFWMEDGCGYTERIEHAGKFRESRIAKDMDFYNNLEETVVIPCDSLKNDVTIITRAEASTGQIAYIKHMGAAVRGLLGESEGAR